MIWYLWNKGKSGTVLFMKERRFRTTLLLLPLVLVFNHSLAGSIASEKPSVKNIQDQLLENLTESQYWLDTVGVKDVWNISKGNGIRIAVLDDGIDGTHPAFTGRVDSGVDFVYSKGETILAGTDSSLGEHGTAVASVAAASTWHAGDRKEGRIIGVTGIAPEATLLPVRVLGHRELNVSEETLAYRITKGIEWAVNKGNAEVVLMSLGVRESVSRDLCEVISKYKDKAVFIAAAGNSGFLNMGPQITFNGLPYPAGCDNVISVGALDTDLTPAPFSTFDRSVDIAAPGVRILAAIPQNSRRELPVTLFNGTSVSAPMVAGAAALLLGKDEETSPSEVVELLLKYSRDVHKPGIDSKTGRGVLDINAAFGLGVTKNITDHLPYLFTPAYDKENTKLYLAWTEPSKDVDRYLISINFTSGTVEKVIPGNELRYTLQGVLDEINSVYLKTIYKDGSESISPPVGGFIPEKIHPTNELKFIGKWANNFKDLNVSIQQEGINIPYRKYEINLTDSSGFSKRIIITSDINGVIPNIVKFDNLPKNFNYNKGYINYRYNQDRTEIDERYPIKIYVKKMGDHLTIIGKVEIKGLGNGKIKLFIGKDAPVILSINDSGIFLHTIPLKNKVSKPTAVVAKLLDKTSNPGFKVRI